MQLQEGPAVAFAKLLFPINFYKLYHNYSYPNTEFTTLE